MRVVLSTIGRFHTFDLARQIHRRGALTAIFSGYPWFRLKNEGLPKDKVKTFPYLHAPYMRFAPRSAAIRHWWEWHDAVRFDWHTARNLPPCDVFCGLSGFAVRTSCVAKSRGAKHVCDRGSSHIRFQARILREEYERQGIPFPGIPPRAIAREEMEYESADVITVPSTFALNTFVECGVPRHKLRLVPYGVDLSAFYPCAQRNDHEFRVLFAGNVAVRKGVRDLLDAFLQLSCERKRLVFVGSISPELESCFRQWRGDSRISALGKVSQPRLKEIMSASDVMVLPSVEEGLALVQAQAMACGCPVIASENTGASDLFTDGREGFIVPIRDPNAIAQRLQLLADSADLRLHMSKAALERVKSIGGWARYGEKMYELFSELTAQNCPAILSAAS
jgi:glycosyltransferase involved in cell wall biosynthesis